MKRTKNQEFKTVVQAVRFSASEMQQLLAIAIKYEGGNISAVLRKAALEYRGGNEKHKHRV